jgi:predicted nucleotidyltransferase
MIDILEDIFSSRGALKIVQTLLKTTTGYTGREIASMVNVSHQTAHSILRKLVQHHLAISHRVGRANYYQINKDHLLIANGCQPLIESATRWREAVGKFLFAQLTTKPLAIILYGSLARDEGTAESDMDILFIYADEVTIKDAMEETTDVSGHVFNVCGYSMSPIAIGITSFRQKVHEKDQLITQIVAEGISIAGASISEVLHHDRKKD